MGLAPSLCTEFVSHVHCITVSFNVSIVLLVCLIDKDGGEQPARLLDNEVPSSKFLAYSGYVVGSSTMSRRCIGSQHSGWVWSRAWNHTITSLRVSTYLANDAWIWEYMNSRTVLSIYRTVGHLSNCEKVSAFSQVQWSSSNCSLRSGCRYAASATWWKGLQLSCDKPSSFELTRDTCIKDSTVPALVISPMILSDAILIWKPYKNSNFSSIYSSGSFH